MSPVEGWIHHISHITSVLVYVIMYILRQLTSALNDNKYVFLQNHLTLSIYIYIKYRIEQWVKLEPTTGGVGQFDSSFYHLPKTSVFVMNRCYFLAVVDIVV